MRYEKMKSICVLGLLTWLSSGCVSESHFDQSMAELSRQLSQLEKDAESRAAREHQLAGDIRAVESSVDRGFDDVASEQERVRLAVLLQNTSLGSLITTEYRILPERLVGTAETTVRRVAASFLEACGPDRGDFVELWASVLEDLGAAQSEVDAVTELGAGSSVELSHEVGVQAVLQLASAITEQTIDVPLRAQGTTLELNGESTSETVKTANGARGLVLAWSHLGDGPAAFDVPRHLASGDPLILGTRVRTLQSDTSMELRWELRPGLHGIGFGFHAAVSVLVDGEWAPVGSVFLAPVRAR